VKKKWKILIGVVLVLVIVGGVFASVRYSQRDIVTVQTGQVAKQDLTSLVTASGEIKPKNYVNIGANAMGRLTDIYVTEGMRVGRGQLLARTESVQPEADVAAQKASLSSAEAESAAAEASVRAGDESIRTAQASVDRAKADLERVRVSFERAKELTAANLIARQEFDQRQSEHQSAEAAVRESEARLAQARAQREQILSQLSASQRRVTVANATLRRFADILKKTEYASPLEGIVTNLPVRVGETVVPGIQNSQASLIMTIADMSLITAEVKVDETDIVNVKLDQVVDITIDAIPDRTFKGHVIEIGNTAILRSTGLAASQSNVSSQEAKDFKVVVALDNPPDTIRPGLSCTAKITTATRSDAVTIPIQALTVRQRGDLEQPADGKKKDSGKKVEAAAKPDQAAEKARKEELQGVFVVADGKAQFRQVETGITGATDIEVVNGVKEGEEIITGSYKVIRTLRNQTKVKVDNKSPAKAGS
jgi:HlyD family secretion protein